MTTFVTFEAVTFYQTQNTGNAVDLLIVTAYDLATKQFRKQECLGVDEGNKIRNFRAAMEMKGYTDPDTDVVERFDDVINPFQTSELSARLKRTASPFLPKPAPGSEWEHSDDVCLLDCWVSPAGDRVAKTDGHTTEVLEDYEPLATLNFTASMLTRPWHLFRDAAHCARWYQSQQLLNKHIYAVCVIPGPISSLPPMASGATVISAPPDVAESFFATEPKHGLISATELPISLSVSGRSINLATEWKGKILVKTFQFETIGAETRELIAMVVRHIKVRAIVDAPSLYGYRSVYYESDVEKMFSELNPLVREKRAAKARERLDQWKQKQATTSASVTLQKELPAAQ